MTILPTGATATAAAAAAAESGDGAAKAATKGSDAARPAASSEAAAPSTSAAEAAHNQYDDENDDGDPARQGVAALPGDLARDAHAFERDAAALGDASDDAFGAGAQSFAVASVAEER